MDSHDPGGVGTRQLFDSPRVAGATSGVYPAVVSGVCAACGYGDWDGDADWDLFDGNSNLRQCDGSRGLCEFVKERNLLEMVRLTGVQIDIYSSTATTYTCPGPDVWTGWVKPMADGLVDMRRKER